MAAGPYPANYEDDLINNRYMEENTKKEDQKVGEASVLHTSVQEEPGIAILLKNVGIFYRRYAAFFFSKYKNLRKSKDYWALRGINLRLLEGETVGFIGRNGSGKSTISRLISGSLLPDEGRVVTKGKVQLLALGVGFRPNMTGRENVIISGTLLGLTRRRILESVDEIIEFTELGDFIDEPVRTYSAGMKSRLGFAVSTVVCPDILILDEVMSTGDAAFRKKAEERMEKMRDRTKTVLIVSHSPAQLRELCSRVIWLDKGRVVLDGKVGEVLPHYQKFCKNPDGWIEGNKELFYGENNGAQSLPGEGR